MTRPSHKRFRIVRRKDKSTGKQSAGQAGIWDFAKSQRVRRGVSSQKDGFGRPLLPVSERLLPVRICIVTQKAVNLNLTEMSEINGFVSNLLSW